MLGKTVKKIKGLASEHIKRVEVKLNPLKEEEFVTEKHKFSTRVKLNKEDVVKLRRIFTYVERARTLAINTLKKNPDITLIELKRLVIPQLGKNLEKTLIDIVNNELYYLSKKSQEELASVSAFTYSVTLREKNTYNNRFSLTYRRNIIVVEDFDLLLSLDESFPQFNDDPFYLNICIDEKELFDHIYINVFYDVTKKVV